MKVSEEGLASANRAKAVLQARITEIESDARNLRNEISALQHSSANYENQLSGMAGVRKVLGGEDINARNEGACR